MASPPFRPPRREPAARGGARRTRSRQSARGGRQFVDLRPSTGWDPRYRAFFRVLQTSVRTSVTRVSDTPSAAGEPPMLASRAYDAFARFVASGKASTRGIGGAMALTELISQTSGHRRRLEHRLGRECAQPFRVTERLQHSAWPVTRGLSTALAVLIAATIPLARGARGPVETRRLRWRETEARHLRGLARSTSRDAPVSWGRLTQTVRFPIRLTGEWRAG